MGCDNLCSVTPKVKDRFMLRDVTSQLDKYAILSKKCGTMMRDMAIIPEEPSKRKKYMSRGAIMINAFFDSSDSHIAEMIVKGTETGADNLERKMNECKARGCSDEAVSFCEGVIAFERSATGKMMDYM